MEFEYDERKRTQTIAKHEIDILYAAFIFERPVITRTDNREGYNETREVSMGLVGGECFIVVHTRRGNKTRLITAWKGGRKEYEKQ